MALFQETNTLIWLYIETGYFLISGAAIFYSAYQLSKVKKLLRIEQQKNLENSTTLSEKNKAIHYWQTQYFLIKQPAAKCQKEPLMGNIPDSGKPSPSKEVASTTYANLEDKFKESATYSLFLTKNTRIQDEDWEELHTWLNKLYPCFISHIRHLHPTISTQELRISCLIKIGIPIHRIAQIFHLTSQAISHSRSRLYKKMTGKEGKSKDLDLLIANL